MFMVQYLTYVFLVFVLLFRIIFPFYGPPCRKTVPETGSLAATDALGRQAVSAGQSDKKVGVYVQVGGQLHRRGYHVVLYQGRQRSLRQT